MVPASLLTVSGRAIATRQTGHGRALVLVHGAGGSSELWRPQLDDLAGEARVIAVDLPGHGGSDGPALRSIEAHADWIVGCLDAAGLERAVLGGHSMGGAIALAAALAHPHRLDGLVLVGTGARLRVADRLLELLRETPPEGHSLIHALSYGAATPPDRVALVDRVLAATPALVTLGDYLACNRFDVLDRLASIRTPTLVVAGTQDRLTPLRFAHALRDGIPGARLVEVAGAGHFPQLEQPEVVNAAIAAFLRSRPASGAAAPGDTR